MCSKLLNQRSFLREERRLIRAATDKLEEVKLNVKKVQNPEWLDKKISDINKPEGKKRVQLCLGGMVK